MNRTCMRLWISESQSTGRGSRLGLPGPAAHQVPPLRSPGRDKCRVLCLCAGNAGGRLAAAASIADRRAQWTCPTHQAAASAGKGPGSRRAQRGRGAAQGWATRAGQGPWGPRVFVWRTNASAAPSRCGRIPLGQPLGAGLVN